ncbi:HAMP domain-containing histidine kinase [Staphylococcus xylosus]|uniref:HAMP domain-containing sensor histidine kinase n=2 Tax=Staphylococcus xylosus TaxID=1288 RepID=UPI001C3EA7AE|nr:HAMP domain-containing sensor histidine kinase [Staphylococcus xylosus]MEB8151278.1 HAMP domain-containing histidine kinase [Staphylococcus xylosus]
MTIRKQLIYSFMGSLFITTLLVFILYKLMWFDVHQTILLTLCSFVSSMMTMAIAIFFSVPTIHKIERLNDCTDQIAKGNYKVEDLNIQSPKELKELSDAFNQMTIRIDNQMTQIKAEQDEKLAMVQNLAHDLKTPLASIKSYSEGLNDGMIHTELAKQDAYQVLIRQADRLNQMFDDLTDVMSVNNKRSNTRINIDQLLMPILESYQQCLKKDKRQLEVNIPPNIKSFYQDKVALERIVTNFIDNALKFSDTDKVVAITVFEHEGNMLGISVKDEGIGIKQQHLRYIFDRTYRVDNSRNKKTGGSGLGLYIASTLAKQIGGEISVDSTFGQGTTMTVYFPRNLTV